MLYPKEPSLSAELFRHPTAAYRAAPFWAWNCKLEKETLDRQMPSFRKWVWAVFICTSVQGWIPPT